MHIYINTHFSMLYIHANEVIYMPRIVAIDYDKRPWSTMACSQSAAWTSNWSLPVASRAKAFPGRQINSDSTLPRAVHLDGGVIGCHQCLPLALGKSPGISRHTTNPLALSRMYAFHHPHPCPHPTHHFHD